MYGRLRTGVHGCGVNVCECWVAVCDWAKVMCENPCSCVSVMDVTTAGAFVAGGGAPSPAKRDSDHIRCDMLKLIPVTSGHETAHV